MSSDDSSNEETICTPPELRVEAQLAINNLLPPKSKEKYLKTYENFIGWKTEKNAQGFSENVFLAYFTELAKTKKASTLWAIYSMLKATLQLKHNVNMKDCVKLVTWLKRQSTGYKAKKSKIFTSENVQTFLNDAPDESYLAMKVTCIVCQLVFCCGDCRWRHEQNAHGLAFDCPLCRGRRFLCRPAIASDLLHHLQEHLPLRCSKCKQTFTTMEDLADIDKCTSLSELVDHSKNSLKVIDERFDSLYEKILEGTEDQEGIQVDKPNKTAVITPIIRKKYLVDYEASDTEPEDCEASPKVSFAGSVAPKTPRVKRSATPHVKKMLLMARQQALDEGDGRGSPDLDHTAPDRPEGVDVGEMTTPTSRLPGLGAALAVTTSTPTHHNAPSGWALFSQQTDSPLSEIEQNSPQPDHQTQEPTEQTEEVTEQSGASSKEQPKLKSIISSRRVASGDSTERDEARGKRVKFAEDTVFQPEARVKRVFRKPKRMLTPGPTKARFCCNPRFQALINRFEQHNANSPHAAAPPGHAMARTPVHHPGSRGQDTPQGELANVPRAIDFKDSPVTEDAKDNKDELFKSCMATPGAAGMDTAITALTTNIAGSLQTCISNVLKHTEEETEIQFKFTITKKKTSVNREAAAPAQRDADKENLWASVAKAVKNAFWGEGGEFETPHKSLSPCSSSGSKRKQPDRSRSPSPLSHKRGKYEPRLRGRPPLRSGLPLTARLARGDVTSHSF